VPESFTLVRMQRELCFGSEDNSGSTNTWEILPDQALWNSAARAASPGSTTIPSLALRRPSAASGKLRAADDRDAEDLQDEQEAAVVPRKRL
jgi:hypothetical protein